MPKMFRPFLHILYMALLGVPSAGLAQNGSGLSSLIDQTAAGAVLSPEERSRLEVYAQSPIARGVLRSYIGVQNAMQSAAMADSATIPFEHVLSFSRETGVSLEQAIEDMNAGLKAGAQQALREQMSLNNLRVMTAEEYQAFSTETYGAILLEKGVASKEMLKLIRILPVILDEQPILFVPVNSDQQTRIRLSEIDELTGKFSVGPGANGSGRIPGISSDGRFALSHLDLDQHSSNSTTNSSNENGQCGPDTRKSCFLPAVSLHNHGEVRCSGVQIAPGWVLTAAHCACEQPPQLASVGQVTPNRHGVGVFNPVIVPGTEGFFAETDTTAIEATRYYFGETPDQKYKNRFCEKHSHFSNLPLPDQDELGNAVVGLEGVSEETWSWIEARKAAYLELDLVLIKLSRPLALRDEVPIATLARMPIFETGSNFRVAGFGRNNWEVNGGHKTVLSGLHISSKCSVGQVSIGSGCATDKELILTSLDSKTDSCQGDSGAGHFVVNKDGSVSLIAIVSRALKGALCGPGGINVIVASDPVRKWISAVVDRSLRKTDELTKTHR